MENQIHSVNHDEFSFQTHPDKFTNEQIYSANIEEKFHSLRKALEYICTIREPMKVVEDKTCYYAILCIKRLLDDKLMFSKQLDNWSFLCKKNYELIFIDILYCLSKRAHKFEHELSHTMLNSDHYDLSKRLVLILDYVLDIINKITESQLISEHLFDFNIKLVENNLIDALLSFLKCDKYLSKSSKDYDPHARIIQILEIMRNLTENPFLKKETWSEFKFEENLKAFLNHLTHPEKYKNLIDEIAQNINHMSLSEFIEYLLHLKEPSTIANSDIVYNDLFFIKYQVKSPTFGEENLFMTNDVIHLLENVLNYLHETLSKTDFDDVKIEIKKPHHLTHDMHQRHFSILYNILVVINEIIFRSDEAKAYFGQIRMVKCIVLYLERDFVNKIVFSQKKLLLLLIKILSIMSRWSDETKYEWNELNLVETLSSIVNKLELEEQDQLCRDIVLSAYYVIGNLINGSTIDKLKNFDMIIQTLSNELIEIAVNLNDSRAVVYGDESYNLFPTVATLYCLNRFSVHEKAREIIFKNDSYEALKKFIRKGDYAEQYYSLKILSQLCFNDDIAKYVYDDKEICKFLKKLKENGETEKIKIFVEIILWCLKKTNNKKHSVQHSVKGKSVFISFNKHYSEHLVEKIANELQKHHVKIRNSHLISTESYEEVIKHIETDIAKSEYVIMCVCERYRLSYRCQAEAKQALKMNKHIIPLIVQEGFDSLSGWLGSIINYRKHVDFFNKKDFDHSMHLLLEQIKSPSFIQGEEGAEEWKEDNVKEWLHENKIHEKIVDIYRNCDGKTLKQIFLMSQYSPELYYKCVGKETNYGVQNEDIHYFTEKLKILFSNESV